MLVDDFIRISGLKISTWIGVPDNEREHPQSLELNLELFPQQTLTGLGDDIEHTINYFDVANLAQHIAQSRPRRLIETLAEDVADAILARFSLRQVTVEVKKFILSHCDHVAVRLSKCQPQ